MNKEGQIEKIVVVGLGLIGGSIARAIKTKRLCAQLVGVDVDPLVAGQALQKGVVDVFSTSLGEAAGGADLVIIAVPSLSVEAIFTQLRDFSGVISDATSVKGSTVAAAAKVFGAVPENLVPGHPIAGSERSGIEAVDESLFQNKKVILTPLENTSPQALALVRGLWESIGAEILTMTVEHHDEVLAATSHLPHLLAYALVDTLSSQGQSEEIFRYAAGGFRDFTRIASSDPRMWRDIFLANGEATIDILDKYTKDLERMRKALVEQDGEYFLTTFTRAKKSRDRFMNIVSNTAEEESHDMEFSLEPGGVVKGEFRVPGDKSISHRAIILGSIAEGVTTVEGFLEGEDSLATLKAFQSMGVNIEGPEEGRLRIQGVGLRGLQGPDKALYLGNSGTSMRLLCGLLAAQEFPSTLSGDESLSKRPMGRVAKPLAEMGANIELQEGGLAPINIEPAKLHPIHYNMPVASAQVKSCLLLASLYVNGSTVITEPATCRDHTERMLSGFGYPIVRSGNRVELSGGGHLHATHIDVPADISSAAFFMVGASITPGSDVTLRHVGVNPTRTGVINILKMMGADIRLSNEKVVGGEPVADIRVRYAPLQGIAIPEEQVPLAIDEFPALFIAAACAEGRTVLSGAEELRVKESDRIQAMADGLAVLGVNQEVQADGIIIEGGVLGGGEIDSKGDHRIAMAFVMAALRADSPILIKDCNNVATSFPGFAGLAQAAGIKLYVKHGQ